MKHKRRAFSLWDILILILFWVGATTLFPAITGCGAGKVTMQNEDPNTVGGQTPYEDQLLAAHRAAALGLKGRLHIIGGPGHIGPFSYNILGIMWDLDVSIDPQAAQQTDSPSESVGAGGVSHDGLGVGAEFFDEWTATWKTRRLVRDSLLYLLS